MKKSQIWVVSSAHSYCQKLNFDNRSQKTRKSRYQTFLVLSNFTGFSTLDFLLYIFFNNTLDFLSNVDFGQNFYWSQIFFHRVEYSTLILFFPRVSNLCWRVSLLSVSTNLSSFERSETTEFDNWVCNMLTILLLTNIPSSQLSFNSALL